MGFEGQDCPEQDPHSRCWAAQTQADRHTDHTHLTPLPQHSRPHPHQPLGSPGEPPPPLFSHLDSGPEQQALHTLARQHVGGRLTPKEVGGTRGLCPCPAQPQPTGHDSRTPMLNSWSEREGHQLAPGEAAGRGQGGGAGGEVMPVEARTTPGAAWTTLGCQGPGRAPSGARNPSHSGGAGVTQWRTLPEPWGPSSQTSCCPG